MVAWWQPWGQANPRPAVSPELIWSAAALAGMILLGAGAILWVKRWRAGPGQQRETAEQELARFRDLLARGEISPEEFERITGVLRTSPLPGTSKAPPAPPEAGSSEAPGPPAG